MKGNNTESSLPSDLAIRVGGLAKQYVIGQQRGRDETLRDVISTNVRSSLANLRRAIPMSRPSSAAATQRGKSGVAYWALRDVSLEIRRGELVGIIGRNGAGKSTLLKILSRITEPTEGYAQVRGRVGTLLEVGTGFHPELTGRENIYLSGAVLGMSRREITGKFDEIVEFAEVDKFIDTPVKRYSSGMYVRLAFAVAASLESDILLVDEVLAVGDAAFQKKCLGKMGEVGREGRTVLFVSHNMAAISRICQKAYWIENGRIEGEGTPSTVIASYLADGSTSQAEWINRHERVGQKDLLVESARILVHGEPKSVIGFEESFQIEICYRVTTPIRSAAVICHLVDGQGGVVVVSWDTDSTDWGDRIREKGTWRSTCVVPSRFLKPGRYWLTIVAANRKTRSQAILENLLSFEISPDGYPFNLERMGVVTPLFTWHVEKEPGS